MKSKKMPQDGDVITCAICGKKMCYEMPEGREPRYYDRVCILCWEAKDHICDSCPSIDDNGITTCAQHCLEYGNEAFREILYVDAMLRHPGYGIEERWSLIEEDKCERKEKIGEWTVLDGKWRGTYKVKRGMTICL